MCLSWYELTIVSSLITFLRRRRWTTTRTNHHATTGQITWAPRCTSPRNWNIEHPLPLLHITGKHNSSITSSIYNIKIPRRSISTRISLSPALERGGRGGENSQTRKIEREREERGGETEERVWLRDNYEKEKEREREKEKVREKYIPGKYTK